MIAKIFGTLVWMTKNPCTVIDIRNKTIIFKTKRLWSNCKVWNFQNFRWFSFYVKSISRIPELQNLPFWYIYRLWMVIIMNFYTFHRLKFTKVTKFIPPKMAKTAVLELLDSQKLTKTSEISTLSIFCCLTNSENMYLKFMYSTHRVLLSVSNLLYTTVL